MNWEMGLLSVFGFGFFFGLIFIFILLFIRDLGCIFFLLDLLEILIFLLGGYSRICLEIILKRDLGFKYILKLVNNIMYGYLNLL